MTLQKYLDPSNAIDIIEKVKTLRTIGEIKLLAEEFFPGWYVSTAKEYSKDYPSLTENWKLICNSIKTTQAQILLVDEVYFDDEHSIIRMISECFTRAGFSVRKKNDYTECSNCGSIIPSVELWRIFKEKGFKVPITWSSDCVSCFYT
jgi:hypothetical protein